MNIAIDAGCLGVDDKRLKVGVFNFAKELIIHLSKIDKTNNYLLYSFYPIDKLIMSDLGPNFKNIIVLPKKGWMQIWLPLRMVMHEIDVFMSLGQAAPYVLPGSIKTIGFIYDIAFDIYPEYYPGSFSILHGNTKRLIAKSNVLVVSSEAVKNDLAKYYNCDSKKIVVIQMGIRHFKKKNVVKTLQIYNYFLYIGALKRVKNIPTLIRAFDLFHSNEKSNIKLIIVGGNKWIDPEIMNTIRLISKRAAKNIVFTGFIEDKFISKLYGSAIAFISPSYYEGFGLTFVEAMSHGVPVIGSNRGSLPEVVGNAGILIDPTDVKNLYNQMKNVYLNKKLQKKLKERSIIQASKFSWDKTASELYKLIESYE